MTGRLSYLVGICLLLVGCTTGATPRRAPHDVRLFPALGAVPGVGTEKTSLREEVENDLFPSAGQTDRKVQAKLAGT